jgi:Spy/CpxP family protein refolding chaperone
LCAWSRSDGAAPLLKKIWTASSREILTSSSDVTTMRDETKEKNMKNYTLVISALSIVMLASLAPTSFGQKGGAMSKAQAIAQQLNLTPQQKEKILPILVAEAPKVNAIKKDNSLSRIQKMQQVKAIHQQTDPQMKAILSPEQYQKLKEIRLQAVKDAVQGRA